MSKAKKEKKIELKLRTDEATIRRIEWAEYAAIEAKMKLLRLKIALSEEK